MGVIYDMRRRMESQGFLRSRLDGNGADAEESTQVDAIRLAASSLAGIQPMVTLLTRLRDLSEAASSGSAEGEAEALASIMDVLTISRKAGLVGVPIGPVDDPIHIAGEILENGRSALVHGRGPSGRTIDIRETGCILIPFGPGRGTVSSDDPKTVMHSGSRVVARIDMRDGSILPPHGRRGRIPAARAIPWLMGGGLVVDGNGISLREYHPARHGMA